MSDKKITRSLTNMYRHACINGHLNIIKYLEKNNPKFKADLTILNTACYSGNIKMIKHINKKYKLYDRDVNINKSKNNKILYEMENDQLNIDVFRNIGNDEKTF